MHGIILNAQPISERIWEPLALPSRFFWILLNLGDIMVQIHWYNGTRATHIPVVSRATHPCNRAVLPFDFHLQHYIKLEMADLVRDADDAELDAIMGLVHSPCERMDGLTSVITTCS